MKIVCESCGAKYSIADEKVAGKAFKIRCKKCSSVIVVRSQEAAPEEGSTRVVETPTEPDQVWHVVVNGDQQGPFTPGQIGEMLSQNMIDWEAFVWKDGFDNWLPARDVEELVSAVMGGAPQEGDGTADGQEYAAPTEQGYEHAQEQGQDANVFGDLGGNDDDGFGQQATVAASRADFGGAGADLFANPDTSGTPFEAGGHDDDVVASAAAPRVSSPRVEVSPTMTGARNENSVLFSLSNLQALATGPTGSSGGAAPAPAPKAGMASGEGSGLIDIRALASSVQATSGGGSAGKKDSVDDLLSIGGGAAPFAPTLGAPILAPVKQQRDSKPLIFGVVAGIVVIGAIAAAAVVYLKGKDSDAANSARIAELESARLRAERTATELANRPQAPAQNTGSSAPAQNDNGSASNATASNDSSGTSHGGGGGGSRNRNRGGGGGSRSEATPAAGGAAATPAAGGGGGATASRGGGGGGSSIDNLLDNALRGSGGRTPAREPAAAPAPAADPSLPERPDSGAVRAAIAAVQPAVSACAQGQHGLATTSITVAGPTGRVSNVNVTGQFAGTPQGTCVARAVRGARFPRFRQDQFTISFPFRL